LQNILVLLRRLVLLWSLPYYLNFKDSRTASKDYSTSRLLSHPRLNSHNLPINITTYEAHKMLDERAMEAALAEMNAALVPNASAIAKKYGLERTTLKKRFLGQTTCQRDHSVGALRGR
jgi:hypothetical protein